MKKKIGRVKMYYFFYKNWQKFIHRFNYHHMKPNITKEYAWCHWCGLRDKIVDLDKIKDQILPPKETKRMKYTEAEKALLIFIVNNDLEVVNEALENEGQAEEWQTDKKILLSILEKLNAK